MKKLYILLIAILSFGSANAQWQQTSLSGINVNSLIAIGNNIFTGSDSGKLYLTNNNGSNWSLLNSNLPKSNIYSLDVKGNNLYVGIDSGVYLSTNNGLSWIAINNGLTNVLINTLTIIDTTIYVGTLAGGMNCKSINNNSNWINSNLNTPNTIYSIKGDGTNILVGDQVGQVYKSSNNGTNWVKTSAGLGEFWGGNPVKSIIINGSYVYASVWSEGIYRSTINDTNWVEVNNGLTEKYIYSFVVYGTYIIAGGSGGNIYYTNNNGTNWSSGNFGLSNSSITCLLINGGYIYAGTSSKGIWKLPLSELGVKENTVNNKISIYPNPTSHSLTIETNSITKQKLEILNLLGQSLYTYNIYSKATIDVSAFQKGIYILKLNTEKGTIIKKFVKD